MLRIMRDELQAIRDFVVLLHADNDRLWQNRTPVELLEPGAASASTTWLSTCLC